MATDLTAELHQGFDADAGTSAPFMATSASWLAWMLGRYMAERRITRPRAVSASRGDDIRADSRVWTPITSSRTLWRRK